MTKKLSRRDFLHLTALSSLTLMTGCAANPVSGRSQFMLVSENQELALDKKNSPYQLSSDYGILKDTNLNSYLNHTGHKLARLSHRPSLPYSFQCVNASYVNAYAFPGGTIAVTRGILLELGNEAELAALLGHELGHVNARHTAQQMSKGSLVQGLIGGISAYANTVGSGYGKASSLLGSIGAGALLASYSRAHERQADSLAMEYMVKGGYNPSGSTALMTMLTQLSKHDPSAIELMFSTHPMSQDRLESARRQADSKYRHASQFPIFRERYMDNTASLRSQRKTIQLIQKGEEALAKKQYQQAEELLQAALKNSPNDYAGLAIMAKCQLVQNKNKQASKYAARAKQAYPNEAQAHLIGGLALLKNKQNQTALADFEAYDRLLPGNPNLLFFKGLALEGMQRRQEAASNYYAFIQAVNQGEQAQYAHQKLVEWKYIEGK